MVIEPRPSPTVASQFHARVGPLLAELDFDIVNDPGTTRSPYQKSHAIYRARTGLYLLVGFEPADGNSAGVYCGRRWSDDIGWYCLSNALAVLAHRYDLQFPEIYEFGYGDEIPKAIDTIGADLEGVLPTVLSRVNMGDLSDIEREDNGAQKIAEQIFGPDYRQYVHITEFPAEYPGLTA